MIGSRASRSQKQITSCERRHVAVAPRAVRIDTGRAVFAGRLPVAPWLLNPILLFCDVLGLLDRPVFILDFFRLKEPFIELAIVLLHWVKGRSAGEANVGGDVTGQESCCA